MKNSILYHDGCDICALVGQEVVNLIGLANLDIIHIGLNPSKQIEAKNKGVKAFPALVLNNGNILHFNVEEHEGSVDCLF
ncbi:conserved hypothetical protein [Candidatus Nitrotoga sp. BS]|uniref:thioredoxin family protein n=1 Tax=Candidatus Nitrotoga sp. BS TaxID=2890408 RepID=UPI001EF33374|nr:thioredoxin family protein [Candidatus Nitrotoga sp. BS]CAH1201324.1 conserved hypothetical protein [Candidatus Nitrotoga sp. BS]